MRQLFVVALVVGLVAAPACAQRGGGGHGGGGGFHGGSSGHGGFAPRGGFARPGGYGGGYGYRGGAFAPRYGVQGRALSGGVGVSGARPAFYHRGWDRRRGNGSPYGYGVGYVGPLDYGWLDADDPGYDSGYDSGDGDDGSYDGGPYDDGSGVAAEGYGPPQPGYGQAPSGYDEQPIPYAGAYAAPEPMASASTVVTAPSLFDDNAVTLVFKDGRAPEKIHNYALTRTMLYVTDGRRQEIPVAALNWPATEKINREAGVDFQLPVTP